VRALRWHGARDLRLDDVDEPATPTAGEAIIEVAYCGICGTDLAEYTDGPVMIRPGPHPLTGASPPLVLGHEFSGRVTALGDDVAAFEVGQRVTVDPCWRCDVCYWCVRGDYHICKRGGSIGLASDGALAPLVRVPASGLVALPDEVDDRTGALVEPLAVGLHAVRRGAVNPGDRVLVIGCGPIGAAVILCARAAGALVYVSEPTAKRREVALTLGASEAFDPAVTDVRREVYLATGRIGPDVVLECTGIARMLPFAVDAVRRGGRVVLVGIGHGAAEVETQRIVPYEREILGSLGYRHDLPRVVELLRAGSIDPAPVITGVVPLEEAVEGAFEVLLADRGEHMKLLVRVGGR
jgi:(R,R)-butanediol dehydrogenase / meso-butanediol dehydrogenase / diacetyl reductase